MYSPERIHEGYSIVIIWKISQCLVDGYEINFVHSPRRGRLAQVSNVCNSAPSSVRRARESSLSVKGSKLFNILPIDVRNYNSTNVNGFKHLLDNFLSLTPDQPTIHGQPRAARTNSLLDQIHYISI